MHSIAGVYGPELVEPLPLAVLRAPWFVDIVPVLDRFLAMCSALRIRATTGSRACNGRLLLGTLPAEITRYFSRQELSSILSWSRTAKLPALSAARSLSSPSTTTTTTCCLQLCTILTCEPNDAPATGEVEQVERLLYAFQVSDAQAELVAKQVMRSHLHGDQWQPQPLLETDPLLDGGPRLFKANSKTRSEVQQKLVGSGTLLSLQTLAEVQHIAQAVATLPKTRPCVKKLILSLLKDAPRLLGFDKRVLEHKELGPLAAEYGPILDKDRLYNTWLLSTGRKGRGRVNTMNLRRTRKELCLQMAKCFVAMTKRQRQVHICVTDEEQLGKVLEAHACLRSLWWQDLCGLLRRAEEGWRCSGWRCTLWLELGAEMGSGGAACHRANKRCPLQLQADPVLKAFEPAQALHPVAATAVAPAQVPVAAVVVRDSRRRAVSRATVDRSLNPFAIRIEDAPARVEQQTVFASTGRTKSRSIQEFLVKK